MEYSDLTDKGFKIAVMKKCNELPKKERKKENLRKIIQWNQEWNVWTEGYIYQINLIYLPKRFNLNLN